MNLLIFGSPGSGKGTYASRLAPKFDIVKISTGDLLRDIAKEHSPLGKRVAAIQKSGELVPDEITNEVLKKRILQADAKKGIILDGYPRTLDQANFLEKIIKIDAVINLKVPDDVIVKRLSGRLQCKNCGAIYQILTVRPKKEGICDKCGGGLYQREDDKPEVVKNRLEVYRKQSEPLIEYYKNKKLVREVECNKFETPPEVIVEKIVDVLKKRE